MKQYLITLDNGTQVSCDTIVMQDTSRGTELHCVSDRMLTHKLMSHRIKDLRIIKEALYNSTITYRRYYAD